MKRKMTFEYAKKIESAVNKIKKENEPIRVINKDMAKIHIKKMKIKKVNKKISLYSFFEDFMEVAYEMLVEDGIEYLREEEELNAVAVEDNTSLNKIELSKSKESCDNKGNKIESNNKKTNAKAEIEAVNKKVVKQEIDLNKSCSDKIVEDKVITGDKATTNKLETKVESTKVIDESQSLNKSGDNKIIKKETISNKKKTTKRKKSTKAKNKANELSLSEFKDMLAKSKNRPGISAKDFFKEADTEVETSQLTFGFFA